MEGLKRITRIETDADLECLIQGGAFLGSGGGGPIAIARQIKEDILSYGWAIPVVAPETLAGHPEWTGAVAAFMGSPEAGAKGIDLNAPDNAFKALGTTTAAGRLDLALLIEIGAGNSLVPLAVAVRNRIPVVDGDGAGRAVPKLQNTTYALTVPASPAALSNGAKAGRPTNDTLITLRDISLQEQAPDLESYCLKILEIPDFGQCGGLAAFRMTGTQIAAAALGGTLSFSYGVGAVIRDALSLGADPTSRLVAYLGFLGFFCKTFGIGTVIEIREPQGQDLDVMTVVIRDDAGRILELSCENENLFARCDGELWAMAPDLICYMTPTGPASNVEIQVGLRVTVVGVSALPPMRQAAVVQTFLDDLKALKVYDGPYIPIEKLNPAG